MCGAELEVTSTASHIHTQHDRSVWTMNSTPPLTPPTSKEYRLAFSRISTSTKCPVEGCLKRANSRPNLRLNFMHRHVDDKINILDKDTDPYPQCEQCDMFVPWETLTAGHLRTKIFRSRVDKKRRRLAVNAAWIATGTEFRAHDRILENVDMFKCLGQMLYFDESY